jgi:hypothetical protein
MLAHWTVAWWSSGYLEAIGLGRPEVSGCAARLRTELEE